MKRTLVALVILGVLVGGQVKAATVEELQAKYVSALQTLIAVLTAQLQALQAQLATMQTQPEIGAPGTAPIVSNSSSTASSTPNIVQATTTPSCALIAYTRPMTEKEIRDNQTYGNRLPPDNRFTHVSWTLTGIPTSTRGKVYRILRPGTTLWDGHSMVTSTEAGYGLVVNPNGGPLPGIPGNTETDIGDSFPYGLMADFNGTQCFAYP